MQTRSEGVRRLSLGLLAARELARQHRTEIAISRKELSAAARDAMQALELRSSVRQVLHELVGSYGEQELTRGLMVWPSNRYLEGKTGLSERAIRNCLRVLVELRLIAPDESPNRKRFAVRNATGTIVDAFGFNLAPLIVRRGQFATMIAQQKVEAETTSRLFDQITIARKAIQEAIHQIVITCPDVVVGDLAGEFDLLSRLTPKRGRRGLAGLEPLLGTYRDLRERVEKLFYDSVISMKGAGYASTSDPHIESNNEPPTGSCSSGSSENEPGRSGEACDLALVLTACPAVAEYHDRPIGDLAELVLAGRQLRGVIGAHASAWTEAVEAVGAVQASILVALVLQMHTDDASGGLNRIRNPGGLFRSMVRRVRDREVELLTELQALRRRHMG